MTTVHFIMVLTKDQLLIMFLQLKLQQILAWGQMTLINLRIFYF